MNRRQVRWCLRGSPGVDGEPHLPPGPPEPAWLQTIAWYRRPLRYLACARARYGRVFTSRILGYPPLVHVTDPVAIREVFTGPGDALHAGEANAILEPLLGARSLLLLDGAEHLRQRRLLLPPLSAHRVHAHAGAMREIARRSVDGWPRGRPFRVHPHLSSITLDVIMRTVLGLDAAQATPLRSDLLALLDSATSPLVLLPHTRIDLGPRSPWGRFCRLSRRVDEGLHTLASRRRRDPAAGPDDVLGLLLRARDEDGRPCSAQLRDQLVTLLVAGHETVASSLAWTLHHLVGHPDALARAEREADGAPGPWIDAVVNESLRLTPVLPVVARRLQRDMTFAGVHLPRGVRVAPSVHLAHREPEHWPRPHRFAPERFLGQAPSPLSFFPFGGGAHRCIGLHLALLEMRVVLATILARVHLRAAPGPPVRPVRRGVTLAPSGGLPLVAVDRA